MNTRRILFLTVFLFSLGRAGAALAHGSGEIEIFLYLLEEPGFFRIATLLFGGLAALFGGYVLWKGGRELAEAGGRRAALLGPGAAILIIAAGVILTGFFIVPDQVVPRHHEGEGPKPVISPGRSKSSSSP